MPQRSSALSKPRPWAGSLPSLTPTLSPPLAAAPLPPLTLLQGNGAEETAAVASAWHEQKHHQLLERMTSNLGPAVEGLREAPGTGGWVPWQG